MKVLTIVESDWFAKGLQIYDKEVCPYDGHTSYKFGSHVFHIDPLYEFPLDSIRLEWVDYRQTREPNLFQRMGEKLFGVPFEREVVVRPTDGSIVVVEYDNGRAEMAEFSGDAKQGRWVTELFTGVPPTRWAYLPDEVMLLCENKKKSGKGK